MNYTSKGFTLSEVRLIESVLQDPRSWGAKFRQVSEFTDPKFIDIEIYKLPNKHISSLFPTQNHLHGLSVTDSRTSPIKIYFSAENWADGGKSGFTSIIDYRTYVINHEFGHALGYGHAKCPKAGGPAHIMQQQTLGTGDCYPYPWVIRPVRKNS